MRVVITRLVGLACALWWLPVNAQATNTYQWEQVDQCRIIAKRLERLRCFDQLFDTPVALNGQNHEADKPKAWMLAYPKSRAEDNLTPDLNESDSGKDAWVTLPALPLGDVDSPVLVMSCMDEISRVQLALPKPLIDARISVSVAQGQREYWRSDDEGVVFSSAQGLPAIELMKRMAQQRKVTLRSNSETVDGLQFDTVALQAALRPLRQRCRW
ncbi:type VI secretion protein VasI [Vibrio orientalis CIP 102891 = ATCC 33934]|uniref:Type VI secretion protein VasI n=1 Tax=Vibrio orientalis CIP 102891 = ATCC 33934 TaxID=675816 RepID=A0ABM9YWN1_VIBOR|nr:type VI secretion protein VasI [Vibrio orientalis CIP 102891 = ATCC 33934]